MSNLPAINASVWVDRFGMIVHSTPSGYGPSRLPVVRVLHHPDVFVRLEFGEFEGPSVRYGRVRMSRELTWHG